MVGKITYRVKEAPIKVVVEVEYQERVYECEAYFELLFTGRANDFGTVDGYHFDHSLNGWGMFIYLNDHQVPPILISNNLKQRLENKAVIAAFQLSKWKRFKSVEYHSFPKNKLEMIEHNLSALV